MLAHPAFAAAIEAPPTLPLDHPLSPATKRLQAPAPSATTVSMDISELGTASAIPLQPVNLGFYRTAAGTMEQIKLPLPAETPARIAQVSASGHTLELKNNGRGTAAASNIRMMKGGQLIWEDQIPGRALLAAVSADASYSAASTEDGGLWVWSKAGRRILPCVLLEGPGSFLVLEGNFLGVLNSIGTLDIWDLTTLQAVLSNVTIAPVLSILSHNQQQQQQRPSTSKSRNAASQQQQPPSKPPRITSLLLTKEGLPILLSHPNGAYSYEPRIKSWTKIADSTSQEGGSAALEPPYPDDEMRLARIRKRVREGAEKVAFLARGRKLTCGFLEVSSSQKPWP